MWSSLCGPWYVSLFIGFACIEIVSRSTKRSTAVAELSWKRLLRQSRLEVEKIKCTNDELPRRRGCVVVENPFLYFHPPRTPHTRQWHVG